jgi:DNA-binding NarL/FixJ family response regulator
VLLESPELWRRRIYRNTYTRNGRVTALRHWSVKIQYQGRRRTFSLRQTSRIGAADEAFLLYQTIVTEGWEAAMRACVTGAKTGGRPAPTGPLEEIPRSEAAYWKERLIKRKYREACLTPAEEFSARIEHAGRYAYFPLGRDDRAGAAARAGEIYRTIVDEGWEPSQQQFRREITIAIFWAASPAACTYTTLFTLVGDSPADATPTRASLRPPRKIALVEADPVIRRTLAFWLDRQTGFRCLAAYKSMAEVLDSVALEPPDLLLVNRNLPQSSKPQAPRLPILSFGVYEDSDQIFINLSGVTAGYIFRRRPPAALLEPIQPALRQKVFSEPELAPHIRTYFQSLFGAANFPEDQAGLAHLTAREQDILGQMSKGYQDKEIAEALRISIWTVRIHLKHIFGKLNVHTRTEALLKYLQK